MFSRNLLRNTLESFLTNWSIYICILLIVMIMLMVASAYAEIETCCDLAIKIKDLKVNECATITKSNRSGFYQIIVETGSAPPYPFERIHIDYASKFVESCLEDYQFVMVMRDGSTNYFLVFYPEDSIGLGAGSINGSLPLIFGSGYGALPGGYEAYKYSNEYGSNLMNLGNSTYSGYGLFGGTYGGISNGLYSGFANPFASPLNYIGMYGIPQYANSGLFSPFSFGSPFSSGYLNAIAGNLLNYMMATNTSILNGATSISGYETIIREPSSIRNAHSNGSFLQRLF